jgi:hypothetical protein
MVYGREPNSRTGRLIQAHIPQSAAGPQIVLLAHVPAARPSVPPSTSRRLARAGLIGRASRERISTGWCSAWAIADRAAALHLLARLPRPSTLTLYPE